jgi:hypothetical protein
MNKAAGNGTGANPGCNRCFAGFGEVGIGVGAGAHANSQEQKRYKTIMS